MSRLRPGRRTAAILAILLLLAIAGSDLLIAEFWVSHPMLTAIVSALVVVILSVAVIEVVLSRRAERRWRVLAQTALMELGEAASTTWRALAEVLDLPGASEMSSDRVRGALVSDATGPKVRREIEPPWSIRSFERSWPAGWPRGLPTATKSWDVGRSP
jgi:hypothetical protein